MAGERQQYMAMSTSDTFFGTGTPFSNSYLQVKAYISEAIITLI